MDGRTKNGKEIKKTSIDKSYKREEVVESHNRQRLEGTRHMEEKILVFRGKESKKVICLGRRKDDGRKCVMKEEKKEYS